MRVSLEAGDMLYIPCGYWHRAQAVESNENAISLAVGVMSRSAMDLFDFLRDDLRHSLVWRQRLPVSDDSAARQHLVAQLSADLSRTLRDPAFLTRAFEAMSKNPS